MQTDAAALLLFPRVERHLLDQLRYRQLAHFRRPAVALDRFFGELGRQLRRLLMLQRLFQRFGRGDFDFGLFHHRRRLPAIGLFLRRGLLQRGRGRTSLDALGNRTQSLQRSVIHRPRAGSGCRFTLFWGGCSLAALQVAAGRQHLAGGRRQTLRRLWRRRGGGNRLTRRGRGGLCRLHLRLRQRLTRMKRQGTQQRHFDAHPPVRGVRQLFAANQQRLVVELNVAGRYGSRQFAHPHFDRGHVGAQRRRRQLNHGDAVQQALHLDQQRLPLDAACGGVIDARHDPLAVGSNQRFNQRQRLIVIKGAEHGAHRCGRQLPFPTGNRLIGQA